MIRKLDLFVPNTRDDFNKLTTDALARRAAFICSNPDCRSLTIGPSGADGTKFIYVGIAAHICAAAPGGPRYDESMISDVRASCDNGIFLCSNCASMIDKNGGADFSVDVIREWKRQHEQWVAANLNKNPTEQSISANINVTSYNQSGGITAGVVNLGTPKRSIDAALKQQMAQMIIDKSTPVTIDSLLGDGEALAFATDIKNHLVENGYIVNGVNQVVPMTPMKPQEYFVQTRELRIGSRN